MLRQAIKISCFLMCLNLDERRKTMWKEEGGQRRREELRNSNGGILGTSTWMEKKQRNTLFCVITFKKLTL